MALASAQPMHVLVEACPAGLPGVLVVPQTAPGIVLFAHGSGSGRLSPRNQFVASVLNRAGIGTLLFDLLTPSEADDRANVFNIRLLADRLLDAARWVASSEQGRGRSVGLFGASTGAAAALVAAAEEQSVAAVVSRGGRPDLAMKHLPSVRAPTLLIVGGDDTAVLRMNEDAYRALACTKALEVVPGATHLFEEPGALERVADLAGAWFGRYLTPGAER
jgi:putative phosphoribosyl transferase